MTSVPSQMPRSALVAQIQLENLQSRRTSDKISMMYKTMNDLVDVNPANYWFARALKA